MLTGSAPLHRTIFRPTAFAGLAAVILIGLLVENLLFANIERLTIKRWGMQR